jgi:hypothetical protein
MTYLEKAQAEKQRLLDRVADLNDVIQLMTQHPEFERIIGIIARTALL